MDSPFSSRLRLPILLSPLIFIALAALDRAMNGPVGTSGHTFELFVILLATMPHVVFTLVLTRLPEVGAMIEERFGIRERLFWSLVVACFGIGVLTFLAGQGLIPTGPDSVVYARVAIEVLAFHHGIRQIFGVSLLYNARLREQRHLNEATLAALAKSERSDRLFFDAFLVSFCSFRALDIMTSLEDSSTVASLAAVALPFFRFAGLVFCAVLVGHASWHAKRFADREKLLYFGRFALFALALSGVYPVFMGASLLGAHAVEYFGIYDRMRGNSSAAPASKRAHVIAGLMVCVMMAPFVIANHVGESGLLVGAGAFAIPLIVKWLAAIEGGLDFTHYFLDRQIFRMRLQPVRTHVAPLLATRARDRIARGS